MRVAGPVLALCVLVGCRENSAAPIRIDLGPTTSDELTLIPRASLAELIEISANESTLFLTLTSAERTCEAVSQVDADASVSVRLKLPGGRKLEPGSYPLLTEAPSSEVPAIDKPAVDKPTVQATVKLRGRRQELRSGGELTLSQVDLSPQGSIDGLLKFEFTGDAEHPATRVSGHFLAHFCRINRLR
jgi:hypothetical protein